MRFTLSGQYKQLPGPGSVSGHGHALSHFIFTVRKRTGSEGSAAY